MTKTKFPPPRKLVGKQVFIHVDDEEWDEFLDILYDRGHRHASKGSAGKFLKSKMIELVAEKRATK